MPVLVGKFLGKLVDLLAIVGMAPITGLDPPGSKLLAKRFFNQGKVAKRFVGIDGPPLERGTGDVSARSRALMIVFSSCRRMSETSGGIAGATV